MNVITLLTEPEQAKTLTLAQRVGDLTLVLRNEADLGEDESPTIALDDLWDYGPEDFIPRGVGGGGGAASADRNVRREVQVIRGLQVSDQLAEPNASTEDGVN